RHLGDEPALAQVLLPPDPDLGDVADAVEGDGEHVAGLTYDEGRLRRNGTCHQTVITCGGSPMRSSSCCSNSSSMPVSSSSLISSMPIGPLARPARNWRMILLSVLIISSLLANFTSPEGK